MTQRNEVSILTIALSGAWLISLAAHADPWVVFEDETDSRLVADPEVGAEDDQERDYAVGDLNNNGWIDLVVMRKQPFTTTGNRRNVLFLNEEGILVDRTVEYASASSVQGDEGFLTPTNDRDCVIVDVDNSGWLDVVTAATLSDGHPKHISHPRIYMNQGIGDGTWQGLVYEDARIPQLEGEIRDGQHAGMPHAPRFSTVASGDVIGNGYADLFFGDHDAPVGTMTLDFNDRLLVNDGSGHFADESHRIPSAWLPSWFTSSTLIADLNGNGTNDIARVDGLGPNDLRVFYNDSENQGHFVANQFVFGNSPYYVNAVDLNNNGRLDLVVAADRSDHVIFNMGVDDDGLVIWQKVLPLPNSLGFRSNVVIADLNNSGWPDVMIANVHIDVPTFGTHARMYRNNADGPQPTFSEDYGNLDSSDFMNTFDFAAFDITGNGWNDLVVATGCKGCNTHGTSVFINQAITPCPEDLSGDDIVNVLDLLILLEEWGECDNQDDCPADLNGDGEVNVLDLLILLEAWGPCP